MSQIYHKALQKSAKSSSSITFKRSTITVKAKTLLICEWFHLERENALSSGRKLWSVYRIAISDLVGDAI